MGGSSGGVWAPSWASRSSWPATTLSLGYSTRQMFSERARASNNAQVLCLGARVVAPQVADILVDHWLATEFAGGDSARKVGKIDALDAARAAGAKGATS